MTIDVKEFLVKPLSEYRGYSVDVIRPLPDRLCDPQLFLIYEGKTLVAQCRAFIKYKLLPKTVLYIDYVDQEHIPHEKLLACRTITAYEFIKLCKPSKVNLILPSINTIDRLYDAEALVTNHTPLIDKLSFYNLAIQLCGDDWVKHDYFYNKLIKAQAEYSSLLMCRKAMNEDCKSSQ